MDQKILVKREYIDLGGKLPPQEIEAEEAVLGVLLIEPHSAEMVLSMLTPDSFYKDANQRIFKAIVDLHEKNEAIDILTVTRKLRERAELELVGGVYYISTLTNRVVGSGHVEEHATFIQQAYIKRQLIALSNDIANKCYEPSTDPIDAHTEAQKGLDNIIAFKNLVIPEGVDSLNDQLIAKNQKLLDAKGISGIPSGLTTLDRVTGGWQPTDLIILAARPGMGKTSLAAKYARTCCQMDKGLVFFSQEMSRMQLFYRIASNETGIPLSKFMKEGLNRYEMEQYDNFYRKAREWKIIIDDTPALSIQDMKIRLKQYKRKFDIDLIITDYLQLHTFKGAEKMTRNDEIGKISGGLKQIAKEFEVPLIALSQLSRSVESRGGTKEPMLSDLRDSGSIEQDADMVQFLYRPEYYGITEDEKGQSLLGVAKIDIAKHRNGGLDTVSVKFIPQLTEFDNLAEFNTPFVGASASSGMQPNTEFDNKTPF